MRAKKPENNIKESSKKKTAVPETDFEKSYHLSSGLFSNMEGLKGFELYKKYRDGIFQLIEKEEYVNLSPKIQKSFAVISDLQFIDKAYLDNFILCFALQLGNPKAYKEFSDTVDAYVRPDKRSAGLQHINKELACLFVHVLNIYADISTRQATNISKQVFSLSESEIKSRISTIKKNFSYCKKGKFPPKIVFALLFIYIAYKKIDWDKMKSVPPQTIRTKKAHNDAITAYKNLRNEISRFYIKDNVAFMRKHPNGLHDQIEDDPNILRFDEYDLKNIDDEKLACILGYSVCMDFMPNLLIDPTPFMKN